VLRLHYVHPGGLVCFLFFEGMILLAVLLALAELVTWWIVIILPVSVAAMVKINDVIAGLSFTQHGKAMLPRRIPAVARGSAAVEPTVALPVPEPSNWVGRAVGRAVGTAPAPGWSGRTPSPHRGMPPGTNRSSNGAGPGAPHTAGPVTQPVGGQRGHGPAGAAPSGEHVDPHGLDPHGRDPHGRDPHGSDLHGSDLHGRDPHGSDLHGGDLHRRDPHGIDRHGSDPHGSEPHGRDLNGRDPSGHDDPRGHGDLHGYGGPGGDLATGPGTPLPRRRAAWHGPNERRFDRPA
jgi:hypothetical protein